LRQGGRNSKAARHGTGRLDVDAGTPSRPGEVVSDVAEAGTQRDRIGNGDRAWSAAPRSAEDDTHAIARTSRARRASSASQVGVGRAEAPDAKRRRISHAKWSGRKPTERPWWSCREPELQQGTACTSHHRRTYLKCSTELAQRTDQGRSMRRQCEARDHANLAD
jgi:hypothetical protein